MSKIATGFLGSYEDEIPVHADGKEDNLVGVRYGKVTDDYSKWIVFKRDDIYAFQNVATDKFMYVDEKEMKLSVAEEVDAEKDERAQFRVHEVVEGAWVIQAVCNDRFLSLDLEGDKLLNTREEVSKIEDLDVKDLKFAFKWVDAKEEEGEE
mmetsp:Transcript_17981/g.44043  ORF Transcript_17981/g.44043 Transcript_17981/m.44043 type:complete len:152 (-) Transcript_17981:368-823(-)|eukprot:CAMPEP_0114486182 /NCGR_PEP_ID=MMETSP0109-20121206/81_1 /TAXON_ID=29199 /ORGANISM="Chlorarachnion reptans, Strain CCCM449" /LENGTH=151 /DNA_ID=CAMNT_0001662333 /DNA_START=67 /DNA_END=522 /DNA_ORIENTATION=-